jgi:hypothetical protein
MSKKLPQSFLERCYKDKNGNVAIFQAPNLPIAVGLTSTILAMLIKSGSLQTLFSLLGFGTFFTWAWLEIFSGDSYFRRILGVTVLIGLMYNRI